MSGERGRQLDAGRVICSDLDIVDGDEAGVLVFRAIVEGLRRLMREASARAQIGMREGPECGARETHPSGGLGSFAAGVADRERPTVASDAKDVVEVASSSPQAYEQRYYEQANAA